MLGKQYHEAIAERFMVLNLHNLLIYNRFFSVFQGFSSMVF